LIGEAPARAKARAAHRRARHLQRPTAALWVAEPYEPPRQRDTSPRQIPSRGANAWRLDDFASAHPVRCVSPVTTTDGRSPGSRVVACWSPSQIRRPSGQWTAGSPLTVAGAAAALEQNSAPHSLLISRRRTVAVTISLSGKRCQQLLARLALNATVSCAADAACCTGPVIRNLKSRSRCALPARVIGALSRVKRECGARAIQPPCRSCPRNC